MEEPVTQADDVTESNPISDQAPIEESSADEADTARRRTAYRVDEGVDEEAAISSPPEETIPLNPGQAKQGHASKCTRAR